MTHFRHESRALLRGLTFLSPWLIGFLAFTLIPILLWLWLFNAKLGLINTALGAIGVANPPGWLTDVHWAMPALILMSFWGIGNTVVIYLAGLQDVPRELYEASEIDGATTLRQVWHV